jgi:F-type H+-transporting ATPase subunit gamma
MREIRERIGSIGDTMKITNAMYLISSTKLRKARESLENTEPYFLALQMQIERIMRHLPEGFTHPYLDTRLHTDEANRKRAFIVVSADKGLAGAYNHNVLKLAESKMRENRNAEDKLFIVGESGRQYFSAKGCQIDEQFHYTAQNPTLHRSRMIVERMMTLYGNKEIDELHIIYTRMVNSLTMQAECRQLLPLYTLNSRMVVGADHSGIPLEEFEMRPSPESVIENLIPNYMTGFIYGALVESFCSEQNSRMMAMDAANKNGAKMKQELTLQYNRARQARITQEITEVVAGARAQQQRSDR